MLYAEYINASAARHAVPPELIAGVIASESAFNPRAYRAEPQIGDASRGLMQLLERTARALGYEGAPEGLYDPRLNVELGTRLLRQNFNVARAAAPLATDHEIWTRALSAYNAGFSTVRPGDVKRDQGGQIINQPYIDRVRRWAARFSPAGPVLGALAVGLMVWIAWKYGRRV